MAPNERLRHDSKTNRVEVSVVDIYNETSWREGVFSFENESLEHIMRVLCRWYDMEVVFENEDAKKEEFFGLLRKDQDIEKIMVTIMGFGTIKAYELKNRTLIIK